MARRTPDPGEIEVELVEVVHDAPGERALPGPEGSQTPDGVRSVPGPGSSAPRRRRRRVLLAVAATVVVAAVAVAQLLESGRLPTAGVVEGRVGSMPVAPDQLWHEPDTFWSFVDDDVVVHGSGRGATVREATTGDVVREHLGEDAGDCQHVAHFETGVVVPVVLCARGPLLVDGQAVMVLTALAPRDGSTLWEHTLRTSRRWGFMFSVLPGRTGTGDPLAEADVLWLVGDDGTARLARLDLATGTVRWTAELEDVADEGLWLQVAGDVVVVGEDGLVDLATGERVDSGPVWQAELPAPGGTARFVVGEETAMLSVLAPDGSERFEVADAYPVGRLPIVSDHARVFAFGASDGATVVVDAETGEERWRSSATAPMSVVAYLRDVLVVRGELSLRGLDPLTGEELWSVPVGVDGWSRLAVDERRLLAGVRVAGEPRLMAVDVETGDVAWDVPVPSPVQDLHAADGVLIVQMENGTIAFPTG